ncbi:MAG: rhodanese-like domain-containing protein [Myxococcota bacterium]
MIPLLSLLACASEPSESPAPSSATEAPAAKGSREDTDLAGLEAAIESKALVVDVRTDDEWKSGHVPGAVHLPLSDLSADHPVLKDHDPSVPVYFVCESGGRSGRAADAMAAEGFRTVNVKGGTGAWRSAGKPLETP